MYKKNKSQVSVDFLIVLSVVFIIFIVIFSISVKRNDILDSKRVKLYAEQIISQLAAEINSVFIAGPGTTKLAILPDTLRDNTAYDISIHPEQHIVNINYLFEGNQRHLTRTIITGSVSGNLSTLKNDILISNQNGEIIIS